MELQVIHEPRFGKVRVIVIGKEVLFAGKDVAAALGFKKTYDALRRHVQAEDKRLIRPADISNTAKRGSESIPNAGMTFINESGLYSLVMRSNLPTALEFQHWVTSEVLPSIREKGYYITPQNRANCPSITTREKVDLLFKSLDYTNVPNVKNQIVKTILFYLSPNYDEIVDALTND